jgi:2,3,4,5-tetrahydropyridine-2-carboxylate N-succinyltransferase
VSSTLESDVTALWERYDDGLTAAEVDREELDTLDAFLDALEAGEVRAAEKRDGTWAANEWVKRGVLLNFGLRETVAHDYGGVDYHDVLPLRRTDDLHERGTRNTPDGTVIRRGAYIGSDAILMSPAFVNVGAHVGDGTLVDSCDTVGSCAQIGENVKLGANTLVGGVLEPVEDAPVVVEDGVSLGAGCRVTSGFVVGEDSIVGENTLLTPRISSRRRCATASSPPSAGRSSGTSSRASASTTCSTAGRTSPRWSPPTSRRTPWRRRGARARSGSEMGYVP